jgi:spore coat polysaccharide biosynthesis predicted glycosyltransferase SpsG
MPWPTEVRVNVSDMAALMTDADVAIGAAGTTALERCSLGLPTLTYILAANQEHGAASLEAAGAIQRIHLETLKDGLFSGLQKLADVVHYRRMANAAAGLVDCEGTRRVAGAMLNE